MKTVPPTGKEAEIQYVASMASALNWTEEQVKWSLVTKPFCDDRRGWYLMDIGQIMKLLPKPPGRLVDLGCGPGWTSRMYAAAGYEVLGLDICPEMIELSRKAGPDMPNLHYELWDYTEPLPFGEFDLAVIYDALHHATDEAAVVRNVYAALAEGGLLITAEPGAGHSQTELSRKTIGLFGTTEKDMPFTGQRQLMLAAGFKGIEQYLRLSELPLEAVQTEEGRRMQADHFRALGYHTEELGFTSFVVARK